MRIPMTMRDARSTLQRSVPNTTAHSNSNPITDGRCTDPTALSRPGFRVLTVSDKRETRDALRSYETRLVNAHRINLNDRQSQCPDCDGDGDIDGEECETCHGSGVVSDAKWKNFGSGNEGRRNEDSKVTREQAYRDYDLAIVDQWRGTSK